MRVFGILAFSSFSQIDILKHSMKKKTLNHQFLELDLTLHGDIWKSTKHLRNLFNLLMGCFSLAWANSESNSKHRIVCLTQLWRSAVFMEAYQVVFQLLSCSLSTFSLFYVSCFILSSLWFIVVGYVS